MACPHCGSWSVKADRGLAGRLVCGRCGRPLGRGQPSRRRRTRVNPNRLSLGMALAALVSLAALLAVWDLQRSRLEAPLDHSHPADSLPAL
jgi:hypothetical protein